MERSHQVPEPPPLLLDACCVINLLASGSADEIIEALPVHVAVADYVLQYEILSVRGESSQVSLRPLVERGLIDALKPTTVEEDEAFVNLALQLDDGEAMTGALAIHRGAPVATDDRKAIRVLTGQTPPVEIRRTSELVKEWSEVCEIPPARLRRVLGDIEEWASFQPPRDDPLRDWWSAAKRERS